MFQRILAALGFLRCDWCERVRWRWKVCKCGPHSRVRCNRCCGLLGGLCTPADAEPQELPVPTIDSPVPLIHSDTPVTHYSIRTGPALFEERSVTRERYSYSVMVTGGMDPDPDRLVAMAASNRRRVLCDLIAQTPGEVIGYAWKGGLYDYLHAAANRIRVAAGIRDTNFTVLLNTETALKLTWSPEFAGTETGDYGLPETFSRPGSLYTFDFEVEDGLKTEGKSLAPVFPDDTLAVYANYSFALLAEDPCIRVTPDPVERTTKVTLTDTFAAVALCPASAVLLYLPPVVLTHHPESIP